MAERYAAYQVWRRQDGSYFVRVYGWGVSRNDAIGNAVERWHGRGLNAADLRTASETELERLGMPIEEAEPLTGRHPVTLRIDRQLIDAAKRLAERERRSFNSLVELALERYIDEHRASMGLGPARR